MPKSHGRVSFISVLVYASVVLFLLYLAFFQRGFHERFADVGLSGRYKPLPLFGAKKLGEIDLSYQGLDLVFSADNPLLVKGADGKVFTHRLDSWRSYSDETDILYESGIKVRLMPDKGTPPSYTLTLETVGLEPGTMSLRVPFRAKTGARITEGAPVLTWGEKEKSWILSLPSSSRIDLSGSALSLETASTGNPLETHFGPLESASQDPFAAWLSRETPPVSLDQLQREITAFLDDAFAGWSRTRLSADALLWRMPDGKWSFQEEIGRSLIAESIARGSYPQYRALYQQALAVQLGWSPQGAFTLSSSPYIGNLQEYVRRVEQGEAARIERLRGLVSRSDLDGVCAERGVIPYLIDHGPFSLVQDAIALLGQVEPKGLAASTALGALEALLDGSELIDDSGSAIGLCRKIIENAILPAIVKTDKGIFLQEKPGLVDVQESLRAAGLLMRAGADLAMPAVSSIGRSLMEASIRLSLQDGFLPALLRLSSDSIASQEGIIPPEKIYEPVAKALDRYLPEETPLNMTLGPGAWMWSAARVSVEANDTLLRFTVSFPAGLPNYLVVQGVKPFTELRLHGAAWSPLPEYAQYPDGWIYDARLRTLFVKVTGRQDQEEITITY